NQLPRLWLDRYSTNPTLAPPPPPASPPLDRFHPYFRSEAARKLSNNVTTVSNVFTVTFTVVFHEVRTDPVKTWEFLSEPGTGRPLLGKEVYKEVPGDLRQQYFAVIDRTNSTLDVTGAGGVGPRPFFTTLESVPVPENWSGAAPTPAS